MSDPRLSFLSSIGPDAAASLYARLEQTRIQVVAGPLTTATFPGQLLLYQLVTLLARLFDRVELLGEDEAVAARADIPLLAGGVEHGASALPTDGALAAIRATAAGVRPHPAPVAGTAAAGVVRVLVGAPTDGDGSAGAFDLYVGSTGWAARLSAAEPQEVADTTLSVGALAAGALGAGEVFKHVFGDVLSGVVPLRRGGREGYSLSLLTYRELDGTPEPEVPSHIAMDATLFGCGSVGCAVLLGVLVTRQLTGRLTVVDNGIFDERNPYKYALLDWAAAAAGMPKAVWAQRRLAALAGDRLRALAFWGTTAEYVASLPRDYRLPLAVSAVDTTEARLEIQDTLPRRVVNAGIDGTTAEVSVHGFGDGPCLACLGLRRVRESWSARLIAARIGLREERVHALIVGNAPLNAADVVQIRAAGRAPADLLADVESFIGQPVLSFYNRVLYSEARVTTAAGVEARVTTAFVSAFAGVLVLAEMIKDTVPALAFYRVDNSYRQQLLGVPADGCLRYERDATGWCACHSSFRRMVYREKYDTVAVPSAVWYGGGAASD